MRCERWTVAREMTVEVPVSVQKVMMYGFGAILSACVPLYAKAQTTSVRSGDRIGTGSTSGPGRFGAECFSPNTEECYMPTQANQALQREDRKSVV